MLLAVCKATGLECECIPRIASALGGGVGRQGEVCGAVTGGVMAVGLLYGRDRADETDLKEEVHAKAGEFVQRFAQVNGALRCRELIDLDVSSEGAVQEYYARNLMEEVCVGVVRNAVRALLDLRHKWDGGHG